MPDILLATLNAKYAHAAFGLRYLHANLGPLRDRAAIREFDVAQRPIEVAEALLREEPAIVGLGVYVWNVALSTRVVSILKRVRPDLRVVIGGPEVSHPPFDREIVREADYLIAGEADVALRDLCATLLAGRSPAEKILRPPLPDLSTLELPYDLYDDADLAERVTYVEASRGCPYTCEFCLSALDERVRAFPPERFLAAMERLLDRGARRFKFVDRTFNLSPRSSRAILEFFAARATPDLHLHFEMVPDRFPEALKEVVKGFPPGVLQFEVGIQSFHPDVLDRIARRQDDAAAEANLRFLAAQTGVHVHADLIVGLPGEDVASFARGFDRLVRLGPQEIQIGLLKRLPGAPIARHDAAWGMVYDAHPPYEVLSTGAIDFAALARLRRFARLFDLVTNSGNFMETAPKILDGPSPFTAFLDFTDRTVARAGRVHAIALPRLCALVFAHLVEDRGHDAAQIAEAMVRDYCRGGRRDPPEFLRGHLPVARRRVDAGGAGAASGEGAGKTGDTTTGGPAGAAPSMRGRARQARRAEAAR